MSRARWEPARSGAPSAWRDGRWWTSRFDPVVEARRSVTPLEEDVVLIILAGAGAGYHVAAWAERYPERPVLVLERDAAWWDEVVQSGSLNGFGRSPHHRVFIGPTLDSFDEFLQSISVPAAQLVGWRPQDEDDPQWRRDIAAVVARHQARSGVNWSTARRFLRRWAANLQRNEETHGWSPLSTLEGIHAGTTATIVAAGPSLDLVWDDLGRRAADSVVIAVDTSWPALHARGLSPDYLVILDGQYWNARHVDAPVGPRTRVVTELVGPPRAFALAAGRTFVATTSLSLLRRREESRWGRLGELPSGGSVATAAWSLALLLGCVRVDFFGLDLAYPRARGHASGTQFESTALRRSHRLAPLETASRTRIPDDAHQWVPSTGGGLVRSDPRLMLYRDWISRAVTSRPDVVAVNWSPCGAQIEGLVAPGALQPQSSRGSSKAADPSWTTVTPPHPAEPPFALLESAVRSSDFDEAWRRADKAAREWWGDPAWDSWIGRARALYQTLPCAATKAHLRQGLQQTLDWALFWPRDQVRDFSFKDGKTRPTMEGS